MCVSGKSTRPPACHFPYLRRPPAECCLRTYAALGEGRGGGDVRSVNQQRFDPREGGIRAETFPPSPPHAPSLSVLWDALLVMYVLMVLREAGFQIQDRSRRESCSSRGGDDDQGPKGERGVIKKLTKGRRRCRTGRKRRMGRPGRPMRRGGTRGRGGKEAERATGARRRESRGPGSGAPFSRPGDRKRRRPPQSSRRRARTPSSYRCYYRANTVRVSLDK